MIMATCAPCGQSHVAWPGQAGKAWPGLARPGKAWTALASPDPSMLATIQHALKINIENLHGLPAVLKWPPYSSAPIGPGFNGPPALF